MGIEAYAVRTTMRIVFIGALILFRICVKTRLLIPVLYCIALESVWSTFEAEHTMLAHGIGYGMLVIVALSWIVSIVCFIHRIIRSV